MDEPNTMWIVFAVLAAIVVIGIIGSLLGRRNQVWEQFAQEIGGDFIKSFWGRDKVVARMKEGTLTLDSYWVGSEHGGRTYTRMTASYGNPEGFGFTLYRRGLLSGLGKLLGMQDIEIGDPEFDRDFIIKGDDATKIRALLAHSRIRPLIQAQPAILFQAKHRFFGATNELYFEAPEEILDLERLKSLYELFVETLQHLSPRSSTGQEKLDRAL